MLRSLLAAMLVACTAPTSVAVTPTATSVTRSVVPATPSPAATAASSPTSDPAGLVTCGASQLRAVAAGLQGPNSFLGAVFFANSGAAPCTLRGNPEVVLLAKDGSPLDVRLATVTAGTPTLVVVPVSQLRPDPAGLLGAGATAPLEWSNYCDDVLPMTFRVTLPEGGVIDGTFVDLLGQQISTSGAARCDDASGTSTLTMYPFQEPRR